MKDMFRNKIEYLCIFKWFSLALILITSHIPEGHGHKFQWGPCLVHFLEPCSSDIIKFYLFTSDRPENQLPITLDHVRPEPPSWLNMSHPMKMIIHGYGGYVDYNATRMIRTAYLNGRDLNIIVVDWGKLARLPCYPSAVINTKQAGECTAALLRNLEMRQRLMTIESENKSGSFQIKNIHAIGFSLGAHVAGFASNAVEEAAGHKFRRITALDPALPFFATPLKDWKLDKTDADFVDVIHTNGGVFGKVENCGHVDFYVNGGLLQPQCSDQENQPLCSHMSAPNYFAESITSEVGFWGVRCENYFDYLIGKCGQTESMEDEEDEDEEGFSLFRNGKRINGLPEHREDEEGNRRRPTKPQWQLMGEHCNASSTGIFAVKTHEKYPFAMGLVLH